MPRSARKSVGGVIYHVLNRGNGRQRLFHTAGDYDAFVALLAEVKKAVPGILILAYCLMPNHFHLVLLPRRDGDLSRFMQRLLTAHVRRYYAHRRARDRARKLSDRARRRRSDRASDRADDDADTDTSGGHLYQGRFKSFPVQEDDLHLLTLLRYVESNPLRGQRPLARKPAAWRWTSFAARAAGNRDGLLDEWPIDVPRNWAALVSEPMEDRTRDRLLASLERGRPFGDEKWTARSAARLGLAHTLRPRGRPPKSPARSTAGASAGSKPHTAPATRRP
jgi:REP-associated tyrosine transposase